jgi:tetratricopeptide (TPR) repeat protein
MIFSLPPRAIGTAAAAAAFLFGAVLAGAEEAEAPTFDERLDAGVNAARAGDREEAGRIFLELVDEYPEEAAVYYNLALTYEFDADGNRYRGENLNTAVSYYSQALALDPGFTPARLNMAALWYKLDFPAEAEREYRLVIGADAGELARRAEYNLALILKEKGRYAEAEEILTRGENPYDDAGRVRLLALLAEDAGEVGRAIRLWKRALGLDADPALSALAVQHLQTLRGY